MQSIAYSISCLYLCQSFLLKMTSSIYKSFVWLWMAALFSASVGVSVHQVYCYCLGETTVSLFDADDACQAHVEGFEQVLPIANPGSCCAKKAVVSKPSCCEKSDLGKDGCTKKTTRVFQLKTEYEVGSVGFKKLDSPKTWALAPVFKLDFQAPPVVPPTESFRIDRPPPPLYGRMMCVRHGIFRC